MHAWRRRRLSQLFEAVRAERPEKLLKAFARVALGPGETKTVRQAIPFRELKWWNPASRDWVVETGLHHILAGSSSRDQDLLSVVVEM